MAYENGDLMKSYISEEFLSIYEHDNSIFDKLLTMFNSFKNRTDWPYCFKELDDACKNMNIDLESLIFGSGRYVNDNRIKWEGLSDKFKMDYTYFFNTIQYEYNIAAYGRFNSNGYRGIAFGCEFGSEKIDLRIIKNNGEFLDLYLTKNDIEMLVYNLQQIVGEEDD